MFRFDLVSFLIGLLVAFGLSALLYRRRVTVADARARLADRARRLRDRLTANIENRYQAALRAHLDQLHAAGADAAFDALYVPVRFVPPPPRPTLAPDEAAAPEAVTLSRALRSARRLAITGPAGAGRTTALSQIARLHLARQAQSALGLDRERLPVWVDLAEIDWAAASAANALPALLDGATTHLPRLIAPNAARLISSRLRADAALLLLDGFDELTPAQRLTCATWLAALLSSYPECAVIVAAGPTGYGPLHNLGCAALVLADWTPDDIEAYAGKWIDVVKGGKQDRQVLAGGLRQLGGLAPRPIDLALAAGVWHARAALPASRVAVYEQWIDRRLEADPAKVKLPPDKIKSILGRLAWTAFQSNRVEFTFEELTQAAGAELVTGTPEEAARRAEVTAEIAHEVIDRAGVLRPFGVDGWTFTHGEVAAYLAARHALNTGAALTSYLDAAHGAGVLDFYAALTDPAELVRQGLAAPDDLGRQHLWRAARWTGEGHPDTPWRSRVMGELARVLVQPQQFGPLRARALRGLLVTRDKGLPYLLKRLLSHPDSAVRALGLQGLQQLGREADLPLFAAALNDSAAEVRRVAVEALGQLARDGVYAAVEQLIRLLVEADEDTRRLAAELLAHCGEEGHQILREGADEEDLKVRRAAAYGLAAVNQEWARERLRRLERDDTQWFVRSAATDALGLMQARQRPPTDTPPLDLTPVVIDQQGWLVEWAARQGIGIGVGRQAMQALLRALAEGDRPVRLAALRTLQYMGDLSHHDTLRGLLADADGAVRDAAFEALETIGERVGRAIPR